MASYYCKMTKAVKNVAVLFFLLTNVFGMADDAKSSFAERLKKYQPSEIPDDIELSSVIQKGDSLRDIIEALWNASLLSDEKGIWTQLQLSYISLDQSPLFEWLNLKREDVQKYLAEFLVMKYQSRDKLESLKAKLLIRRSPNKTLQDFAQSEKLPSLNELTKEYQEFKKTKSRRLAPNSASSRSYYD